jgi:HEAT repeat protein
MQILGAFPEDKKIDKFLVKFLDNSDTRLRLKAVRSLADRKSPLLEKHLSTLLKDEENLVRSASIDALAVIKAPKLYDDLLAMKKDITEGSLPRYYLAIGNTGGEKAISTLLPEARTWVTSLKNAESEKYENLSVSMLQSILEALIMTESDQAPAAMAEIYRLGDLRIKNMVVFSLSKSHVESAATVLDVLLEETDNEGLRNSIYGAKRRLESTLKAVGK